MKRLTKAGIIAIGAALVSQAAQAQFTANDLYVGFTQATGSGGDYLLDLGQASSIIGQSSVVNLSSDFSLSTFNTTFPSITSPNPVSMGVVGGIGSFPSTYDLYMTQFRAGGAGVPAVAGSSLNTAPGTSVINQAVNDISGITAWPTVGNGVQDSSKSWTTYVSPTLQPGTVYGDTGINPNSPIDTTSGIVYEDLYSATGNNAFTYLGYFTMDTTGASPSLTFTSLDVPEPGTISVLAVGALLLWSLRGRLVRKNA